jgi:GDPmannose 4,6-dehydratase
MTRGKVIKNALIIGVSGQDGSYLARLLLDKGYRVAGSSRDHEINGFHNLSRLGIKDRVELLSIDTNDFRSLITALTKYSPDEIYNLAGQTAVGMSFQYPVETFNSILIGTMNLLECVRVLNLEARIYNAGSGEVFGNNPTPSNEKTPHRPLSPYATAKSAATHAVSNYRDAYGIFCCTGILYNHESPLRPERFVTQKIIRSAERIAQGTQGKLVLGNIGVRRDWGWAPDYVQAMWLMLNSSEPRDFVVATGEQRSLKDFLELAFKAHGLEWQKYVVYDETLKRPLDIESNVGDPILIRESLGWKPTVSFEGLLQKLICGRIF